MSIFLSVSDMCRDAKDRKESLYSIGPLGTTEPKKLSSKNRAEDLEKDHPPHPSFFHISLKEIKVFY